MEEIFETLRKQIKGDFDQNNIIIILDNSISLTCKKHPISGTNNSIIIIQPYLIDTLEKTGIQSISMYEQYQMIAVYQNQIPYLDLLPNFPYINEYLNDYKYLIIYESPKYILLQDIPNQLYDYLEQLDLFPFQGYSTTFQELEYNYNYHIRYKSQVQKIKEQLELKQNQLIKNLILSNQINNVTPTQIKIQF